MMLKRKITQKLIDWKNDKNKKCLIVNGARQVGKTYIIDDFGKNYYENYVRINFIERPELIKIFDNSLNAEEIIKMLKVNLPEFNFVPEKTLIFFDEIQVCPNAITALKFLTIYNKYDIIVSGSLLGLSYKYVSSFPVGYVERLTLYSLDFEEFLWANGITDDSINYVRSFYDNNKVVPDIVHEKMMKLFKDYIVIGGMPEVVETYVMENDYLKAYELQKQIIEDYRNDIIKYAEGNMKPKIRACFDSIPKHLSKDYKKFKYSDVESGASSRKYGGCLQWLNDAGIINFCYNLNTLELPLEGNSKSDVFKVYMSDTGLLMAMLEEGSQLEILNGNLGIYKGAIYENIIADIFAKKDKKLYYFEKNSTLEIDFILRLNNKIVPIEVKSADNTKSKSLKTVIEKYNIENGIKLSSKNVGVSDNIYSYPLYMSIFID